MTVEQERVFSMAIALQTSFTNARSHAYKRWLNAEKAKDKAFWRDVLTVIESTK